MKTSLPSLLLSLLLLTAAGTRSAANTMADALADGKFTVNARLRSEDVQQTGLRDANALTLRTRLGFMPAPYLGWTAMVEGENIVAYDGDAYSQAGLNPGGAGRAVVADPELTELSQAWLAYTSGSTTAKVGRQFLVLDNARFIGDSAWRQHAQTFDAFSVQDKSFSQLDLTYAYLDRINRVFGDRSPQGAWRSHSHLFNASYRGFAAATLTAYTYLLDFRNSPANSCATYGASLAGKQPIAPGLGLAYRADLATQNAYGSSTLHYSANYALLEAGLAAHPGIFTLGYEELGSDRNVGFKTPLATLHAFNGWADLFLTTPAAGLRDAYAKVTANLPAGLAGVACWHQFDADTTRSRLGQEFDTQLSRKFGPSITGLVKFADFHSSSLAYPNVRKVWVQVEFIR